jgi:hypothetical protein
LSLRGMKETENENNVTVYIPRNQQFTVNQLENLMNLVGNGEF